MRKSFFYILVLALTITVLGLFYERTSTPFVSCGSPTQVQYVDCLKVVAGFPLPVDTDPLFTAHVVISSFVNFLIIFSSFYLIYFIYSKFFKKAGKKK